MKTSHYDQSQKTGTAHQNDRSAADSPTHNRQNSAAPGNGPHPAMADSASGTSHQAKSAADSQDKTGASPHDKTPADSHGKSHTGSNSHGKTGTDTQDQKETGSHSQTHTGSSTHGKETANSHGKAESGAHARPEEAPGGRKGQYTGEAGSDFHTFFVDELKDIYWAEKHLKTGLAKMSKASTSKELTDAFSKHNSESNQQIATLETIFGLLGEKPETKRCEAMAGLLTEVESIIEDTKRNTFVRDAGLILAAQKTEHYEIATYGTLLALSEFLPEKKVQKLLSTLLEDERKTDQALTRLAESFINRQAAME